MFFGDSKVVFGILIKWKDKFVLFYSLKCITFLISHLLSCHVMLLSCGNYIIEFNQFISVTVFATKLTLRTLAMDVNGGKQTGTPNLQGTQPWNDLWPTKFKTWLSWASCIAGISKESQYGPTRNLYMGGYLWT